MVNQLPPIGPAPPPSPTSTAPADTPSTWRVGQVLAAVVTANPQPGVAELRIGNLSVRAQTGGLDLAPGQNLRLEVASLKEQPVLKLLGILQQVNPLAPALRDALPRQQPLTPLLTALARLTHGGGRAEQFPTAVARLARELFERLPHASSVATAGGLRQALRDSGLFLETKLAKTAVSTGGLKDAPPPPELARDFKANLLRLVGALRDLSANASANSAPNTRQGGALPGSATAAASVAAGGLPLPASEAPGPARPPAIPTSALISTPVDPGAPLQRGQAPLPPLAMRALQDIEAAMTPRELHRQAEGALARVQLNQLSSLSQERQPGMEWLIELPVRREQETDVWNLRISRDSGRPGERAESSADAGWSVMLAFDLPGVGPMQTRINLRGERISAQFFSHEPRTLALVHEHLPSLQARLRQAGLQIDELTCRHGQIPPATAPVNTRLLDERV